MIPPPSGQNDEFDSVTTSVPFDSTSAGRAAFAPRITPLTLTS